MTPENWPQAPVQPYEYQKETPKTPDGFTTGMPGYETIKIHFDQKGKPTHFVNQNGETIPYSENPHFTKEFAYPNSEFKRSQQKEKTKNQKIDEARDKVLKSFEK